MAKQVVARIVSVPASESETGHDEVYIVFDGKRIAKRAGTAYAGTWYRSSRASKLWGTATS